MNSNCLRPSSGLYAIVGVVALMGMQNSYANTAPALAFLYWRMAVKIWRTSFRNSLTLTDDYNEGGCLQMLCFR